MDKVTAVRKRLHHEQWKSIITECHSSGMTTVETLVANGTRELLYNFTL
jgi:hypothetical protein